jgi:plasmid stability protein
MGTHIHIRDFQEDLHAILANRAKQKGLSLSAYLRQELTNLAKRPTSDDVFERMRALSSINSKISAVDLVREDRDGR